MKIKHFTNIFLSDGGAHLLIGLLWDKEGSKDEVLQGWVVEQGASVCAKELNRLTVRASRGPFSEEAKSLCFVCGGIGWCSVILNRQWRCVL